MSETNSNGILLLLRVHEIRIACQDDSVKRVDKAIAFEQCFNVGEVRLSRLDIRMDLAGHRFHD